MRSTCLGRSRLTGADFTGADLSGARAAIACRADWCRSSNSGSSRPSNQPANLADTVTWGRKSYLSRFWGRLDGGWWVSKFSSVAPRPNRSVVGRAYPWSCSGAM
ncbi:MAG: pentapeptide repeat-containing protein [Elainellaceae cyanobacterium]